MKWNVNLVSLAGVDFSWKVNFLAGEDALAGLSGLERNLLRVSTSCEPVCLCLRDVTRCSSRVTRFKKVSSTKN